MHTNPGQKGFVTLLALKIPIHKFVIKLAFSAKCSFSKPLRALRSTLF
jgi:hypothetical protein